MRLCSRTNKVIKEVNKIFSFPRGSAVRNRSEFKYLLRLFSKSKRLSVLNGNMDSPLSDVCVFKYGPSRMIFNVSLDVP